jgi:NADH-quinone oxidoreductase subunit E
MPADRCRRDTPHVRGSTLLIEEALNQLDIDVGQTTSDGIFTVESINSLGACALGPVVVVNDSYYDHMTPKKLKELIGSVRKAGTNGQD